MSDTKEQAKQAKERGNAAYQAGKYEDAVREFSQAIELDPTDAVFFSNRSMSFASAGNYEAALRDGKKAMELKPDWPKAYSRAGFALYKLSRYDEAKKVYEQGLQHAPQDQGLKDAVKDCEEAISSRDPLGSMGNMFAEKNWDKLRANPSTRELLNDPTVVNNLRMLEKNPNFLSGFFQDPKMSKIISVLMGLPEDLFTKAGAAREKSQQNSGGSNTNTGSSSSAADMDEDDAEELETETKTFTRSAPEPKSSESSKPTKQPEPEPEPQNEEERQQREQKKKAVAAKDRGNELFKAKKFQEALAAYTEAIELDPTDSTFYSNRAAVYYQMKDFEKSVHECNEAIRVGREHRAPYTQVAKTFFRLGETYRAMDRLDEAVAAYERSLLEHNDFKVKKTMKEVQEIKKKRDDEAYINPALSEEHKNKGNALFQEGKWVDAIAEYSEALRRDPKNYKVRSNRALCYTKLMDWNRGLADCEEILKVDPKFIKAYLRKGKIQHFLKQYHKALDTFSAGLTIDPNHEELMQAKRETMAAVNAEMGGGVDPARAQAAMSDPEIKNILRDPTINKVLQDLQNDPRAGQAAMRDPDIRAKIEKLITAGVLRVER